jgi:hypothetical protein
VEWALTQEGGPKELLAGEYTSNLLERTSNGRPTYLNRHSAVGGILYKNVCETVALSKILGFIRVKTLSTNVYEWSFPCTNYLGLFNNSLSKVLKCREFNPSIVS